MSSPRLIYSIYENRLQSKLEKENLPKHIGLITMDTGDTLEKKAF
jgi:hypothetical protein